MNDEVAPLPDAQRLACHILVQEHCPRLLAYAHALYAGVGRPQDRDGAEDLVQESLMIALDHLDRYDANRGFAAWVRGIMRHRLLKQARNREFTVDAPTLQALADTFSAWHDPALDQDPEGLDAGQSDQSQAVLDPVQKALNHCLQALAADARQTVEAFYYGAQPVYDIAHDQGVSVDVVKKRLQRARQRLASCIQKQMARVGSPLPRQGDLS